GKGSTFTVVFPVEESARDKNANHQISNENDLPAKVGKNKKVLVIDDDFSSRKIVELFLRGEIDIETASSANEGLELISITNFSLIMLDISLGKESSGIDVLKKLRTIPDYKSTPVIAVTAHAMVGDREKFIDSGFNDYLSEPFAKKDLSG